MPGQLLNIFVFKRDNSPKICNSVIYSPSCCF